MKKMSIEEAIGKTICHDMTWIGPDGSKYPRFKRGHVIAEADLPVLRDMGKEHIFIWEDEAGEVHEEDASRRIAEAICGPNLEISGPVEGKHDLLAQCPGVLMVDTKGLFELNMVPDFTVMTRRAYTSVQTKQKVASARIVPLVTKAENVDRAVAVAEQHRFVVSVAPFRPVRVGIIITGGEIYYGRIEDKFEAVLREKLAKFDGSSILDVVKCPDDLSMLSDAIAHFRAQGADLILLTGGMSVDPDDLTPTAIRNTGAEVICQGMPMQPGNMLTIARDGNTHLVGVPGASLHSPVTSLDVMLPRLIAGVPITKADIVTLGDGGLL